MIPIERSRFPPADIVDVVVPSSTIKKPTSRIIGIVCSFPQQRCVRISIVILKARPRRRRPTDTDVISTVTTTTPTRRFSPSGTTSRR
jgi:hypothetical protein